MMLKVVVVVAIGATTKAMEELVDGTLFAFPE
jgi:hypothetical protein